MTENEKNFILQSVEYIIQVLGRSAIYDPLEFHQRLQDSLEVAQQHRLYTEDVINIVHDWLTNTRTN